VLSNQSVNVLYAGDALKSDAAFSWKVRAWDGHDQVSAYSSTAIFETGLLRAEEWQGEWITRTTGEGSPLFRQEFTCRSLSNGRDYNFRPGLLRGPHQWAQGWKTCT
jgi:hypothetical protein